MAFNRRVPRPEIPVRMCRKERPQGAKATPKACSTSAERRSGVWGGAPTNNNELLDAAKKEMPQCSTL